MSARQRRHDVDLDALAIEPSAALRQRVLALALAEPQDPRRPRGRLSRGWPLPFLVVAVVLAVGALHLATRGEAGGAAAARAFLARTDTTRSDLLGANGVIAHNARGDAWLVVYGLPKAPRSHTYEIWVIDGDHVTPAGTFDGSGSGPTSVRLTRKLTVGSDVVAVSLEPSGGSPLPRGQLRFAGAIA